MTIGSLCGRGLVAHSRNHFTFFPVTSSAFLQILLRDILSSGGKMREIAVQNRSAAQLALRYA